MLASSEFLVGPVLLLLRRWLHDDGGQGAKQGYHHDQDDPQDTGDIVQFATTQPN